MATPESTVVEDVFLALAEALVILVVIIIIARYILNPLFNMLVRFGSPEIFTASALLLVLGTAQIMESIGLSMAMGAFIAGLLIADSSYRHQIVAEIQPFRGLLLGLFFMTMGMSLNLARFLENPIVLIAIVIGLMVIKFLTLWPLSRLFGLTGKVSTSVSLLLAQGGEFALVLFALAKGLGLLDEVLFQQLLIIVLLSMLSTPALEKLAYTIFMASRKTVTPADHIDIKHVRQEGKLVILAGFGRMGHRIGHIMDLMNQPYVAIDNNVSTVDQERNAGKSVYFGDAQRSEVLRAAGVANARMVIVSIDNHETTERVVSTLHSAFPDIPVFARGHDFIRCRDLRAQGAHFTVSETLESSAELARAALHHLGAEDSEIETALDKFRHDYYERINKDVHES
jgi:voltage-gated potassium channel Kch